MVSNMSQIQLGELTGSLPIDLNGNCNTLAEGEGKTAQFLIFQGSSSAALCVKHEENKGFIPVTSNKRIIHFLPSSL